MAFEAGGQTHKQNEKPRIMMGKIGGDDLMIAAYIDLRVSKS